MMRLTNIHRLRLLPPQRRLRMLAPASVALEAVLLPVAEMPGASLTTRA